MAKSAARYRCEACGYTNPKPLGRCPNCGEWNSFILVPAPSAPLAGSSAAIPAGVTRLSEVSSLREPRFSSGLKELDRVLGGGWVGGGVVLIGGEPGIGKSTLLLQVAHHLAEQGESVLYVAGEESLEQVRLRADRLGATGDVLMTRDTSVPGVIALLEAERPKLAIVDSIQTMVVDEGGVAGSLSQVRESTARLTQAAKSLGVALVLVGHVTKDGTVAGPKVMEHIVDATLYLESVGHYRLLRSAKNRFGSVGELGVFDMLEEGLVPVENPSAAFLAERPEGVPGSIVCATMDGQRPLLLEVQALVVKSPYSVPKRVAVGLDARRVDVILAVLEKRLELSLAGLDVYLNLAGGLRLLDPGLDLAVALAVHSAVMNRALPGSVAVFGEVGLAGEVRTVGQPSRRLEEARRLGFTRIVTPPGKAGSSGVRTLSDAVNAAWRAA
ncbi:MAG TPA: DNA repair protein RadA [Deinococcales bacterium]|nr:DNA repair protein RadA [Deinococcales bacterium]